jgi:hypothetical protein
MASQDDMRIRIKIILGGLRAFSGFYLIKATPASQAPEDEEILVLTRPSADYRHIRDGWS